MSAGGWRMAARGPHRALSEAELHLLQVLHQHRMCSARQLLVLLYGEHAYAKARAGGEAGTLLGVGAVERQLERCRRRLSAQLGSLLDDRLVTFLHARSLGGARLWYLTATGARAVRSAGTLTDERPYPIDGQAAAGGLQAHTLAVNDACVAFVLAALERGDECAALSWQHEVSHQITDSRRATRGERSVQTDAVLRYLHFGNGEGGGWMPLTFFIELDAATETVETLVHKIWRYAQLYRYSPSGGRPAWVEQYGEFPHLLLVLKQGRRAQGAQSLVRRFHAVQMLAMTKPAIASAIAEGMPVSLVPFDTLLRRGPMDAVLTPLGAPRLVNMLNESADTANVPVPA